MKTIAKIVRALDAQPMTIDDLMSALGLSRSSVETELKWLRDHELIRCVELAKGTGRRPAKRWAVVA